MKNRQYKYTFLFYPALLLSCASTGSITVSNVNDSGPSASFSYIYALPQTVVDVYIKAEETQIIPGPYHKFAEKYLGIQHAPSKPEKHYALREIVLEKHTEADPDFIYSVKSIANPENNPGISRLLDSKMILSSQFFSADHTSFYTLPVDPEAIQYTDLSVKRNFEAEKDIEVSLTMPDTLYSTRPANRNVLKEKTIEQKAEEAANFLIKLKKRRFKLVAGQYDCMPEGEAMADALAELARIEKEYLALFIGRSVITSVERTFHYTPVSGNNSDRIVLFRFSERDGFLDAKEAGGLPVILNIEAANKTAGLEKYIIPLKPSVNTLPYRIPDQAILKITVGEQLWTEATLPVYQYGAMVMADLQNR
ncbi:MAG: DUF4831 family protein [Bacteroidales bacterium]|nr:DUF4831 family protein [Bacteroidales bacterium]